MLPERSDVPDDKPDERTSQRQGDANDFKSRALHNPLAALCLDIPQVRGDIEFYPTALERYSPTDKAAEWQEGTLALARQGLSAILRLDLPGAYGTSKTTRGNRKNGRSVNFLSMTHLLIEPLPLGAVSQRLSHRLSSFNLAQKKKHPLLQDRSPGRTPKRRNTLHHRLADPLVGGLRVALEILRSEAQCLTYNKGHRNEANLR